MNYTTRNDNPNISRYPHTDQRPLQFYFTGHTRSTSFIGSIRLLRPIIDSSQSEGVEANGTDE